MNPTENRYTTFVRSIFFIHFYTYFNIIIIKYLIIIIVQYNNNILLEIKQRSYNYLP